MAPLKVLSGDGLDLAMRRRIGKDFAVARERYSDFERVYLAVRGRGSRYLEDRAREYRQQVGRLQDLIEGPVRSECSRCETMCCKLYTPEIMIYMAGTIGGFTLVDYLLTRCGSSLPDPRYESVHDNLCPFWAQGCTLARDHRGYLCLQYFCGNLEARIGRGATSPVLGKLGSLLESFSMRSCLDPRD